MSRFFYAKIGRSNSLADIYLQGRGEISSPAIPIYFNCDHDNEIDFLKDGSAKKQGELFFECGKNIDDKFIVVVHAGKVYILRPTDHVHFKKSTVHEDDTKKFVKLLPCEIVVERSISEVPMVLASIGANRYYSSGTFREISDTGNKRAIRTVLDHELDSPESKSITHAIECLSSVEFETLMAKAFEESGLFVPAYRGGTMLGADLFAYNKSSSDISLGRLTIKAGERVSIQVKLRTDKDVPPDGVDILIACNVPESSKTFGAEWLNAIMAQNQKTYTWLKSSLEWLPTTFLTQSVDHQTQFEQPQIPS